MPIEWRTVISPATSFSFEADNSGIGTKGESDFYGILTTVQNGPAINTAQAFNPFLTTTSTQFVFPPGEIQAFFVEWAGVIQIIINTTVHLAVDILETELVSVGIGLILPNIPLVTYAPQDCTCEAPAAGITDTTNVILTGPGLIAKNPAVTVIQSIPVVKLPVPSPNNPTISIPAAALQNDAVEADIFHWIYNWVIKKI